MTIEKKNYIFGYIKINIVSNNIFITLTDGSGKVLFKYNGGSLKFKGRRKKNPYVASQLIKLLFSNLLKSSIFINFLIIDIKNFIKEKEMYNIISEFATYSKIPDSDDTKNRFKKNKNKYKFKRRNLNPLVIKRRKEMYEQRKKEEKAKKDEKFQNYLKSKKLSLSQYKKLEKLKKLKKLQNEIIKKKKLKVQNKVDDFKSQQTKKYIEIKKKLKMKSIEKSKVEKKIEKKLIEKKPKIIYIKYSNIKAHNGVRKKKAKRT